MASLSISDQPSSSPSIPPDRLTTSDRSTGLNSNQTIKPCLAELPFEIKRRIAFWVNALSEDDDEFSDDSDIEEVDDAEFSKDPSKSKVITRSQSHQNQKSNNIPPSSSPDPQPDDHKSDPKSSKSPPLPPIHALSLVDRTFYEICRPFIWQSLDLERFDLAKLQKLRSDVISRQSEYIKRIWWRVSTAELEEYESDGWTECEKQDIKDSRQWDEEPRSTELLGILESCKNLTNLDIDLRPVELDDQQNFIIDPDEATSKFLVPLSQLRNLTLIGLTAPSNGKPFSEKFLVRLMKDMVHLQNFTCSFIEAQSPNFELSNSISTCQSPLAFQLASLSSLKELELDQADCFDLSWSRIEWQGSLENISLDDCPRTSIKALHEFCSKFSSTLTSLELTDVPRDLEDDQGDMRPSAELENYQFNLSRLRTLSISNELPIQFLKSFQDSKSIELIELTINSLMSYSDLEGLVGNNQLAWPKLERFIISFNPSTNLTRGEIEALELFYLSKGVTLEFGDYDSDDESDDDSIDYEFDDELSDLQHEWQDD